MLRALVLLLGLALTARAAQYDWTWVQGDNGTQDLGHYPQLNQTTPDAYPPSRRTVIPERLILKELCICMRETVTLDV